ncbi:hypothetical protein CC86DRAFT_411786 [Ophiobolus disseminans]|uniref:J domain-containing protein n=1 Tax=Ophiobolus disseminans TaxID=1469910 RepID=A0A6A6ZJR5_9PLEO|nr:hypothetical protein CC86DRAFT_411786 [Ophiobolus disseminans]
MPDQDPRSSFRHLGIRPNASEVEVRTAYKALALQSHPDRADEADRDQATAKFQKLQEAYEFCLSHVRITATVENAPDEDYDEDKVPSGNAFWDYCGIFPDQYEVDDDSDWRGILPQGIGGFGCAWWDELSGEEPPVVLRWAQVCAKSSRNSRFLKSMTKTERAILDLEHWAAYRRFEVWRRRHIEHPEEEEQIQAHIDSLPKWQRRWASQALEEKRSAPGYFSAPYRSAADERACHQAACLEDEFKNLKLRSGTWRDDHNSQKHGPAQELECFRRQMKALEIRGPLVGRHTETEIKLRGRKHDNTTARLKAEIEQEAREAQVTAERREKRKLYANVRAALRSRLSLEDMPDVCNTILLEDIKLDFGEFLSQD